MTQTDASKSLNVCPYRHVVSKPLFHKRFSGYQHFLFTQSYFVSVVCPNSLTYQEVSGHFAVRVACFLRSANLRTFPEKLHHTFSVTNSILIFPLESLTNLDFSKIKYVTNSLSELTFSNVSELETAVQEPLPDYLSPYVHFPSIIMPMAICIIIVILLYCLVTRVSDFVQVP